MTAGSRGHELRRLKATAAALVVAIVALLGTGLVAGAADAAATTDHRLAPPTGDARVTTSSAITTHGAGVWWLWAPVAYSYDDASHNALPRLGGAAYLPSISGTGRAEQPATSGARPSPIAVVVAAEGGLPELTIEDSQFGQKIGQHAADFGLDPADPEGRAFLGGRIEDIRTNFDEVRQGPWNPKGGGGSDYLFFRQGSDVVVAKGDGSFVTIVRGGEANGWYQGSTPR